MVLSFSNAAEAMMFSVGWQEVQRTTSETNQQSFLIWNGKHGLAIKHILWKALFWDVVSCNLVDIYCPWQCGQSPLPLNYLCWGHTGLCYGVPTPTGHHLLVPFITALPNWTCVTPLHFSPMYKYFLTGIDWVLVVNIYQSKFPLCHHSLDKSCP